MTDTIDPPNDDDGNGKERPFDPRKLRLSQRFSEGVDVRRILTTVPVRKPHRQEFIRVHPDAGMRLDAALLDLKEERQTYIVDPTLWPSFRGKQHRRRSTRQ